MTIDDTNTPAANVGGGAGDGATVDSEVKEYVTLAEDEDEPEDEAGEGEGEGESDEGEGGAQSETDGANKRRPGSAKWRDRARRAEEELATLRRGGQRREEPANAGADGDDDLKEPQEKDFKNWLEYDRAVKKYDARMAVREENRRGQDRAKTERVQGEARERVALFNENVKSVRDRIPDYDRVMADTSSMQIADGLVPLIQESPKGPLLAYYLAKNPGKLHELNRMSPTAAARELGRLEARIRTPKGKSATSARPQKPLPRGGAARATPDPSKMSMADYAKWRAGGGG